jgi:hypothetical protein
VTASFRDNSHDDYMNTRLVPFMAADIDGDSRLEVLAISSGWTLVRWEPTLTDTVICDPMIYVVALDEELREEARTAFPDSAGLVVRSRGVPGRMPAFLVNVDGDSLDELILGFGSRGAYVFDVIFTEPD